MNKGIFGILLSLIILLGVYIVLGDLALETSQVVISTGDPNDPLATVLRGGATETLNFTISVDSTANTYFTNLSIIINDYAADDTGSGNITSWEWWEVSKLDANYTDELSYCPNCTSLNSWVCTNASMPAGDGRSNVIVCNDSINSNTFGQGANTTIVIFFNVTTNGTLAEDTQRNLYPGDQITLNFTIEAETSVGGGTNVTYVAHKMDYMGPVVNYINISDGNMTYINGTDIPNSINNVDIRYFGSSAPLTVWISVSDSNMESASLVYLCNATAGNQPHLYLNETQENLGSVYTGTVKMSTSDASSPYWYSADIPTSCLADNSTLQFAILLNDTLNHPVWANDTTSSWPFNITINDTAILKVTNVNVSDDRSGTPNYLDLSSLDGSLDFLNAGNHTFTVNVYGAYNESLAGVGNSTLLYYNTTGALSFGTNGYVDNYDGVVVMNSISVRVGDSPEANPDNLTVTYQTTVDLTGNDTNDINFVIVANTTTPDEGTSDGNYSVIAGPYRYTVDGGTTTPSITAPTDTTIGLSSSIIYTCNAEGQLDGSNSGVATYKWELTKSGGDVVTYSESSSSTTNTRTFTNTDTNNAGTNTVKCTTTDAVGNVGTSTGSTFIVLSSTGGGGGTGGGPSGGAAEVTFDVDFSTTSESTIKGSEGRIKTFSFDGSTKHTITFDKVTTDSVTLTIASDPIKVTLNIGETKNVDINVDGINDMSVTLNKISAGSADLSVKKLEAGAKVVAAEEKEAAKEAAEAAKEVTPEAKKTNLTWLWVTLIVIIVVIVVGYLLSRKK